MPVTTPELYQHDRFRARRKVFKLFGASFYLESEQGKLLAFSKQKAFKLKEDIRVYSDEEMTEELLYIQADRVVDFSAAYKVTDVSSGQIVGSLRRKGFSSMFRDSWEILDAGGNVRGKVMEDSGWKAALRRMIDYASLLMPQRFDITIDGQPVGWMKQNHNIFAPKFAVDLSNDTPGLLPRPLAIATVVLLLAIEGRQA